MGFPFGAVAGLAGGFLGGPTSAQREAAGLELAELRQRRRFRDALLRELGIDPATGLAVGGLGSIRRQDLIVPALAQLRRQGDIGGQNLALDFARRGLGDTSAAMGAQAAYEAQLAAQSAAIPLQADALIRQQNLAALAGGMPDTSPAGFLTPYSPASSLASLRELGMGIGRLFAGPRKTTAPPTESRTPQQISPVFVPSPTFGGGYFDQFSS